MRGFFTLGGNGANFASAVGTPFSITLSSVTDGTFSINQTFTFSTVGFGGSLSQALNIAFVFDRPAGAIDTNQAEIDNVRGTATLVPEPSTAILLFSTAAVALAGARLRRR